MNPLLIIGLLGAGVAVAATVAGGKGLFFDIETPEDVAEFNRTHAQILDSPFSGPIVVVLYDPANGKMGAEFQGRGRLVLAVSTSAVPLPPGGEQGQPPPPAVDAVTGVALRSDQPERLAMFLAASPPVKTRAALRRATDQMLSSNAGPGLYSSNPEGAVVSAASLPNPPPALDFGAAPNAPTTVRRLLTRIGA